LGVIPVTDRPARLIYTTKKSSVKWEIAMQHHNELTDEELAFATGGANALIHAFVQGFNNGLSSAPAPAPTPAPSSGGGGYKDWIEVYS
jgi:hypothetical protein